MFLLFPGSCFLILFCSLHLHSNMFLLFRIPALRDFRARLIYIPICFYYFPNAYTDRLTIYCIYIPICFYYFSCRLFFLYRFFYIYIPICFYYFISRKTSAEYRNKFTFQYVSIISVGLA